MVLLAASELGLMKSLSSIINQYGDVWQNLLSTLGFSGAVIASINKLLSLLVGK
jgi:hypothetical protein